MKLKVKKGKVREFLSQLTFNLTNAQKKVIKEIYDEISMENCKQTDSR